MDVLALIVAVLALGFSVFSFLRQFGLQRRVTEIEEARRREELTSRLEAEHCRGHADQHVPLEGDGPSCGDRTIRSLEAGTSRLLLARGRDWALTVTTRRVAVAIPQGRDGRDTSTT